MVAPKMLVMLAGLLIASNLQLNACSEEDFGVCLFNFFFPGHNRDTDRSLNKHEFVASKLGIIHGESGFHLRALVGKLFTSLKYPAMVAAYFTAVTMTKDEDFGYDLSLQQRLAFGALVAGVTYYVVDNLGEFLHSTAGEKIVKLHDFIENWPSHKVATPEEFYPLFDGLHMEYLNNGHQLIMSGIFVDEVLKKVAGAYIESLMTKQLDK